MRGLLAELGRAALIALGIFAALCAAAGCFVASMPGESYRGPPAAGEAARLLANDLHRHVVQLADVIGERNFDRHLALDRAAGYIADRFAGVGCDVELQPFDVWEASVSNIECELLGSAAPEELVVVGAHYDSVSGSPGANDNASGVSALLELAARMVAAPRRRTLRFVAFANEEPPFFQTPGMGSLVYAQRARDAAEDVVAMLSLETLGFYSEAPGSQRYPPLFGYLYPDRGDFVALVGNPWSRALVRRAIRSFRASGATIASEGIAAPGFIEGVAWSDHWAFWLQEIPAIMVTDTAPFRYGHYHTAQDTPAHLDYLRLASVVEGLVAVVDDLVNGERG